MRAMGGQASRCGLTHRNLFSVVCQHKQGNMLKETMPRRKRLSRKEQTRLRDEDAKEFSRIAARHAGPHWSDLSMSVIDRAIKYLDNGLSTYVVAETDAAGVITETPDFEVARWHLNISSQLKHLRCSLLDHSRHTQFATASNGQKGRLARVAATWPITCIKNG